LRREKDSRNLSERLKLQQKRLRKLLSSLNKKNLLFLNLLRRKKLLLKMRFPKKK